MTKLILKYTSKYYVHLQKILVIKLTKNVLHKTYKRRDTFKTAFLKTTYLFIDYIWE